MRFGTHLCHKESLFPSLIFFERKTRSLSLAGRSKSLIQSSYTVLDTLLAKHSLHIQNDGFAD